MKPPKLPHLRNYISDEALLIKPGEKAHHGLSVPHLVFTYGNPKTHFKNAKWVIFKMLRSIIEAYKSYRSAAKYLFKKHQTAISKKDLEDLRVLLFNQGCTQIGFTKVESDMIFDNKALIYDRAIVVTMEMQKEQIAHAPKIQAGKEVWRTYADLGGLVNKVARFLRRRGYAAHAGPAVGGDANYVLLAQKAGLGIIGKHGMLISKETGPSQRIAVIYTDIRNLPVTDTKEYNWIHSFCDSCNKCVRKCPGKAIYESSKIFDDGSEEHIDYRKCAVPFAKTMGCSVCIKECAFFNGNYDKIKTAYLKKPKS